MRSDLNKLPFAPVVGAMFGAVAGVLVMATPHWLFEQTIGGSFLPAVISAAAPPLGAKAHIMSAILAIVAVGGLVWLAVSQAEKLLAAKKPIEPAEPAARAPSIALLTESKPRPIYAEADLGAPFMSDEAMAFGLEELVLDSTMIETIGPPAPVPAPPPAAVVESVRAMLERLEEAVERRASVAGDTPPQPGDKRSLENALGIAA